MNPQSLPHERLFYVDWLRIIAFALLVLYHVGMLYVPWNFHVKHDPTYPALEPLMRLTNPWRMSLLFTVSGLATGLMLGRPGLARERSKRLLLPLLFGMAVIVPPQAWLQVREQFGYGGSFLDFLRLYFGAYHGFCSPKECLVLPTWNHLWFLPYLWSYTMLLLLALRLLPQAWLRHAADACSRLAGWRLLVLPLLLLGGLRVGLFPRFGETHALLDSLHGGTHLRRVRCVGAQSGLHHRRSRHARSAAVRQYPAPVSGTEFHDVVMTSCAASIMTGPVKSSSAFSGLISPKRARIASPAQSPSVNRSSWRRSRLVGRPCRAAKGLISVRCSATFAWRARRLSSDSS
jgi:hypothetical protein